MSPDIREAASKNVCEMLVYVYDHLGKPCPKWIIRAANAYYGNVKRLDEATAKLCALCRSFDEVQKELILFDGRSAKARRLADWWDNHQEVDRNRLKEEAAVRKAQKLRRSALQKLTDAEKLALGLDEAALLVSVDPLPEKEEEELPPKPISSAVVRLAKDFKNNKVLVKQGRKTIGAQG